ncbi:hypothetical protein O6H91_09G050600 [Diphasiastrum complanatum]|uniref:Uncharacterized protein n=1 Tax=Diphasiastrum complanatum TaxID=34168 RepID=A0ACC2CNX8_DIPCM|nr:hypothetical protein O6H91_09G050600 [Diphasiastrum complanatum]
MERGLLGARPSPSPAATAPLLTPVFAGGGGGGGNVVLDGNKRKRTTTDAQSAYIASMMQGNPKLLLSQSPLFQGYTQQQLPFVSRTIGLPPDVQYEARILLPIPEKEAFGVGIARTKKEAERLAAVDACGQLNEKGLLLDGARSSSTNSRWWDNPKNTLVTSVAFRDICSGGNARALPITLRSSGPDHAKVFVAELAVPLQHRNEVYLAVGSGRNKSEAERACCTAACEKLFEEGLLNKPNGPGSLASGVGPAISNKALHVQQQNQQPAIVGLRDEELLMMEDCLQRLHLELQHSAVTHDSEMIVDEESFAVLYQGAVEATISVSREQAATENAMLRLEARKRMFSAEYGEQRRARLSLPSWTQRQKIIDTIASNRVVVLTGETGCGKTTQVPQYLLEEAEALGFGAEVHIIVTQPRRIAAISVAERVAWERGEPLGKSVGYVIRLEDMPPRRHGSILYCTTGILLRRLQKADGLAGVSHVIVDEVHERELDTDFLLVVVRELLNVHPYLHVVIMSATLDASIFTRYFGGCPHVNIPGMIHPVQVYYLEDLPQLMGQFFPPATRQRKLGCSDEEDIDFELAAAVISWIAQYFAKGAGAILCFLPGWDMIAMLRDRLSKTPASKGMAIMALHSQLSAGEQRGAFTHPPGGMRKVVLATNIAETSVTIDDVVYVVDCGKIKHRQFDPSRNMTTMRVQVTTQINNALVGSQKWTSQASARQRQGRAGRVQAGFCFRLYTRDVHARMLEHQIPEMQRVPLEELCLQIKAIAAPNVSSQVAEAASPGSNMSQLKGTMAVNTGMNDIAMFLSKALQPPKGTSVFAAVKVLRQLGAIDQYENLTPLGRTLAKLAVHPRFGKMLIYGTLLGCLDPLLTIAAAACFKDPFVVPISKRDEADKMRENFAINSAYASDHLVLVSAFEQWKKANLAGQGHSFCERHFLAPMTMKLIAGMRYQFEKTITEARVFDTWVTSDLEARTHVARCILTAGLYPNIAKSELCRESKGMKNATQHAYRWRLGFCVQNGRVFIHPTSVVNEKHLDPNKHYYLIYQEKVQTSQIYLRGCTLLPPLALVLLGWNVSISSDSGAAISGDWMLLEVEGWLKFHIDRRAGLLLLELRQAFDMVLERWVSGRAHSDAERYLVQVIISLLEATCHDMFPSSEQ